MKANKSIGIIFLALFAAAGCTNSTSHKSDGDSTHQHSGDHVFACPMHPQITGNEGDKCSICGMPLEHNDNAGKANGNKYKMVFSSDPGEIVAGKQAVLSLIPKIEGKEGESVPLDTEHEKKIHFIMVRNDLSWFEHLHPEYSKSGKYDVLFTFPSGGDYTFFADYKPTGAAAELEKIQAKVKGNPGPAAVYTQSKLSATVDGYTLTLVPESGKFESGNLQHIGGVLTKGGKAIDPESLENYLGAKAHMVMVAVLDKSYLHVHPSVENGKFDLHTTFDKSGIYRGWLQFKADGKVHTADFTIKVLEGKSPVQTDEKKHAGH